MSDITMTSAKPLMPTTQFDAREALFRLFAAYDPPYSDRSAPHVEKIHDARVKAYEVSLQGIPSWAAIQAVTDFQQGRVERRNRDKMPTGEQLAVRAREIVSEEAVRQQRAREDLKRRQEAKEDAERRAFLKSTEGEQHMADRARRAQEIMARHGLASFPSE